MTQTISHPLPSSLVIHTHSSKKIRARKLAHSLSPSCHSFILTSCSLGLRLHHQHMQRVLCHCLTFTTTSCSAYCTSVIPPSSPHAACAVPASHLPPPPAPKTHARTVISAQSQHITPCTQYTQKIRARILAPPPSRPLTSWPAMDTNLIRITIMEPKSLNSNYAAHLSDNPGIQCAVPPLYPLHQRTFPISSHNVCCTSATPSSSPHTACAVPASYPPRHLMHRVLSLWCSLSTTSCSMCFAPAAHSSTPYTACAMCHLDPHHHLTQRVLHHRTSTITPSSVCCASAVPSSPSHLACAAPLCPLQHHVTQRGMRICRSTITLCSVCCTSNITCSVDSAVVPTSPTHAECAVPPLPLLHQRMQRVLCLRRTVLFISSNVCCATAASSPHLMQRVLCQRLTFLVTSCIV